MATTTSRMGSFYNQKHAASQLRKYREKGPIASTQTLIDALKTEGVQDATLLDIGGGIGVIQHELLAAGAAHATSVDASAPTSRRPRRRAPAVASAIASRTATATSSSWPSRSLPPTSSRSIASSTSIRTGNGSPSFRQLASNASTASSTRETRPW
jgi:hypothetical protein